MKLPTTELQGIGTTGLTGIVLMTLHITDFLTGWYWIPLYVVLILMGIGQERGATKK
tara:strand:- start:6007 stop:6177 length:171 start_codon:yes stop_codon:yes gene_type:complete